MQKSSVSKEWENAALCAFGLSLDNQTAFPGAASSTLYVSREGKPSLLTMSL